MPRSDGAGAVGQMDTGSLTRVCRMRFGPAAGSRPNTLLRLIPTPPSEV